MDTDHKHPAPKSRPSRRELWKEAADQSEIFPEVWDRAKGWGVKVVVAGFAGAITYFAPGIDGPSSLALAGVVFVLVLVAMWGAEVWTIRRLMPNGLNVKCEHSHALVEVVPDPVNEDQEAAFLTLFHVRLTKLDDAPASVVARARIYLRDPATAFTYGEDHLDLIERDWRSAFARRPDDRIKTPAPLNNKNDYTVEGHLTFAIPPMVYTCIGGAENLYDYVDIWWEDERTGSEHGERCERVRVDKKDDWREFFDEKTVDGIKNKARPVKPLGPRTGEAGDSAS